MEIGQFKGRLANSLETPSHVLDYEVNLKDSTMQKLVHPNYEFYEEDDPEGSYKYYAEHLQSGIEYMRKPQFGMTDLVLDAEVEVVQVPNTRFNMACRITRPYITGLTKPESFSVSGKEQIALILGGVNRMIEYSGCHYNQLHVPKLAVSRHQEAARFEGLVEDNAGNVFFLAEEIRILSTLPLPGPWMNRRQSAKDYIKAASRMNYQAVNEQAHAVANAFFNRP